MRKLSVLLVLSCAMLAGFAATATAAQPASTKLSIQSYPGGVFGYVTSPAAKTCAADRKVAVYQQAGERPDPGSDPRVAADRAEQSEPNSYLWTAKTGSSGQFYAVAAASKRCVGAQSTAVESKTPVLEGDEWDRSYPKCGPYISESTGEICLLEQLYVNLDQEGPFNPCRFGPSSGGCSGFGSDAPYPWGRNYAGGKTRVQVEWKQQGAVRFFQVVSYFGSATSGNGAAHLGGTLPSSNSDRFTVTDGYAESDAGYPNGDHFYTPDLPGQAPGKIGGPLSLNWENGSGTDFGSQIWIKGYLYLRR